MPVPLTTIGSSANTWHPSSTKIPAILIDFNLCFLWFGFGDCSQVSHHYHTCPRLADSIRQIGLQKIVELIFCLIPDSLDQEAVFWFYVENNCLQVQEWLEEDCNLTFELEYFLGIITEYTDNHLRTVLKNIGLLSYYEGYVFERWIDHSTALFVHTSNDAEARYA